MKDIFLSLIGLAAAFLLLFVIAELAFHKMRIKTEWTRKFVHLGTGVLTMLFPMVLDSHWQVMLLCFVFLIILMFSRSYNFLPSINNVDRKTHGAILFPVVVYICYLTSTVFGNFVFYYLPILILAICDPIAALMGKKFPYGSFTISGHTKTLVGTLSFFTSAIIVTSLVISKFEGNDFQMELNSIFGIVTVASIAEAMSKNGWDNLTIPISVILLIYINV